MSGFITQMLSNSEADKDAAMQEAEEFGKREGGGAAARAGFYATLTEWAQDGRIDVSDDVIMWDKFAKGAAAGAAIIGGVKLAEDKDDVRKVRVSECRQFIKLGGLLKSHRTNGVEVLDRALTIIRAAKAEGRLKSKATDAMIAVARAQNNDPANTLDDDTIEEKIQPKPENQKKEEDRLEKIRLELFAIAKAFGDSDEVLASAGLVQQRIQFLGGTSKQKAAAKALAKKQAKGTV